MADVIPFDPEAESRVRSAPGARLSRLTAFTHPQLHALAMEYRQAAFPAEYAERAIEIANQIVALAADARAYERGVPPRASHFINRVLEKVTVDG